ncbi:hypothetical protein BC831DRAFT_452553 [Entophlyctis helioformis]|nr:hypothetical protein BC831DRAFT_452553 [Entophlyctis helioformis]
MPSALASLAATAAQSAAARLVTSASTVSVTRLSARATLASVSSSLRPLSSTGTTTHHARAATHAPRRLLHSSPSPALAPLSPQQPPADSVSHSTDSFSLPNLGDEVDRAAAIALQLLAHRERRPTESPVDLLAVLETATGDYESDIHTTAASAHDADYSIPERTSPAASAAAMTLAMNATEKIEAAASAFTQIASSCLLTPTDISNPFIKSQSISSDVISDEADYCSFADGIHDAHSSHSPDAAPEDSRFKDLVVGMHSLFQGGKHSF